MTNKIEVTQADRECARNIRNAWDVSCETAFEIAAQHRLATRTDVAALVEALGWYGEQARLCRLIHSEGDAGRHALNDDGGKLARQALAPFTKGQNDE